MKKYKVSWSVFNLLSDTQAEVVKLQTYFKGLTAVVATSTWFATDAENTLYVGIGGYVIDLLLACFYFEPIDVLHEKA
jgi:hypothetical protein